MRYGQHKVILLPREHKPPVEGSKNHHSAYEDDDKKNSTLACILRSTHRQLLLKECQLLIIQVGIMSAIYLVLQRDYLLRINPAALFLEADLPKNNSRNNIAQQ
jgi:hypothetical protein